MIKLVAILVVLTLIPNWTKENVFACRDTLILDMGVVMSNPERLLNSFGLL